ncbi:MAG: cell division protein FtsL [Candidatus Rokubacteria bacterium]|nr:cell division protein FtsL [Candidatus Rokubacteria bacterium]
MRRSLAVALACALVLVASLLVVVGLRIQQVHLAYELDKLRTERAQIETLIRQLEVEVATLRSPARVETRARALGLEIPARTQVLLAREYVSGRGGLAAAQQARVEASLR